MAEPTCVIHPFSYSPPEFSNENHEENPMYGIGESISFGRFMEDNLSWEKWSSFSNNRNRHVEEAKKYSRPGSVAQKKAYFEAHFKRMAALKAAALLEQANSSQDINQENIKAAIDDSEDLRSTTTAVIEDSDINVIAKTTTITTQCVLPTGNWEAQDLDSDAQIEANNYDKERFEKEGGNKDAGFVVHHNELFSVDGEDEEFDANNVKQRDPSMQDTSSNQYELNSVAVDNGNCNASKNGSSGMTQMEIPPLQKTTSKEEALTSIVKRNPPLSSYMTSIDGIGRAPPMFASFPAKSAASVYPGKENYATPIKHKSSISMNDPDKKRTPLRTSINREFNKILSPVIRKIASSSKSTKDFSSPFNTPAKDSLNGVPEPPPLTPHLAKREPRSHLDSSACESKMPGPRWNFLSTDGLKSPSTGRNKISSPIIPTSFCLRSGDRAARRKQKLEEKFNATTTEKGHQPSKFKEKAEAEINKFRQSFCFKAMSSPDRCSVNETRISPNHKSESTHGSPRRGRQPHTTNTSQNKSSLPPRRPTVKFSDPKTVKSKRSIHYY